MATWRPHPSAKDAEHVCLKCAPAIKARLKTEFAALAASLACSGASEFELTE